MQDVKVKPDKVGQREAGSAVALTFVATIQKMWLLRNFWVIAKLGKEFEVITIGLSGLALIYKRLFLHTYRKYLSWGDYKIMTCMMFVKEVNFTSFGPIVA